jgi:hypothetical protein
MMRVFFVLFLACTFWFEPVLAQTKRTDREYEGLKGAVKTVRVARAKILNKSGKWVEDKPALERLIEYDKQGRRLREEVYTNAEDAFYPSDTPYYPWRSANTYIRFHYDSLGNRTESFDFRSQAGDVESSIFTWAFKDDANGNRISESLYSSSRRRPIGGRVLVGTFTHTYDDRGNRTVTTFNDDGPLVSKWIYVRDEAGNITEVIRYTGNRIIGRRAYKYEFDAKGNWEKRIASKWVIREGRASFEPLDVVYRGITYF